MLKPVSFSPRLRSRAPWIVLALLLFALLLWNLRPKTPPTTDPKAIANAVTNASLPASSAATASTATKASLTVRVALPLLQELPIRLPVNGNITAWQEAIVGAEVNGLRLTTVRVNVGDSVQKNQVLATFADEATRAAYQQAQAQYENAKSEAARARAVQDGGSLSQSQLAQYQLQEKITQAQFELSKLQLANTEVRAPDDGLISARQASVGAVVGVGQELFRLLRQSRMEWRAEVTATEVARIRIGQKASVQIPSGASLIGQVRAIAPTADPQTRNVLVYVDLPRSRDLKAGTFASGDFLLGNSKALTIPAQAIVMRDGRPYVFVVDANQRANQQQIETGRRAGASVEVLTGLTAKDQIAVEGAGFLADRDLVRLVK